MSSTVRPFDVSGHVAGGVVDPDAVRLVVDHRRAGSASASVSSNTAGSTS